MAVQESLRSRRRSEGHALVFRKSIPVPSPSAALDVYEVSGRPRIGLLRFYEPNLQRWINRDPIGEDGGLNLYQYAWNDPANWFDAFGHDPGTELTAAIAAGNAAQIETILFAYEGVLTQAQVAAARAALANIARQQALKEAARQCVKITENQLKKCWGKNIHKVKDLVKRQFSKELKKAGCKNPDMAIDPNGNLVLQCPNGTVIPTGLKPTDFCP